MRDRCTLGWCGGLIVALALVAGCTPRPRVVAATPDDTAPAARHSISGTELQGIMRRLDSLSRKPINPKESNSTAQASERQALADAAAELAIAATVLPDSAQSLKDADTRAEFRAFAYQLHNLATLVSSQAPRASDTDLRAMMDRIDTVCRSCHARFRDPPLHVLEH